MINLTNLKKLWKIAGLKKNWNGYQADPIPRFVILKTLLMLIWCPKNAEIFPTASGTILISFPPYDFDIDIGESEVEIYKDGVPEKISGIFQLISKVNGDQNIGHQV